MNVAPAPLSRNHPTFGAGVALLATACLAAPPPTAASAGQTPGSAAAATPGARPFTHSSAELLGKAGIGWNLGNALDVPDGETAWGNPRVAPELLTAVAQAGFGLVRIPVTWSKHMGPAPDFTLDPTFLARVDEVIGYARAAGLYAVINLHHDGADGFKDVQWLALKDAAGNTTDANNASVKARFTAVWTQIAKHFAPYGEELLFESMNEVHDGYGAPDPRHLAFVNELNREFVRVVRGSGGNNAERHLIVPGYNTNIEHTLTGWEPPPDPTPKRLTLSVHYYDPYLFALQAKTHTWGAASPGRDDWGQEDFVIKEFDKLKAKYVDQGIPVLMGEYGATHQAEFADYQRYYVEYVTRAALERGIFPVLWDNGGSGSGGEQFGLFDRHANTVLHPELMAALGRAAKGEPLAAIALPRPAK
jgi:endoglucanase